MNYKVGDNVKFIKYGDHSWENDFGGVEGQIYEIGDIDTNSVYLKTKNSGFFTTFNQIEPVDKSLTEILTYRDSAIKTMNHDFDGIRGRLADDKNVVLLNAALGLSGEAGEFTDKVKKIILHGQTINRDDLIKELGDIRWYLEAATLALDTTLDEVEARNIEKLSKRYPNGFSTKAAEERKDTNDSKS